MKKEILVKINFRWLRSRSTNFSYELLERCCDSEKAVTFCDWISEDLYEVDEVYDDICELITAAKMGKSGQWKGNRYCLYFNKEEIRVIDSYLNGHDFDYTHTEFETALHDWAEKINEINDYKKNKWEYKKAAKKKKGRY